MSSSRAIHLPGVVGIGVVGEVVIAEEVVGENMGILLVLEGAGNRSILNCADLNLSELDCTVLACYKRYIYMVWMTAFCVLFFFFFPREWKSAWLAFAFCVAVSRFLYQSISDKSEELNIRKSSRLLLRRGMRIRMRIRTRE